MKLRPYQETALEKLRDSFRAGNKRVILQLPTGAGKTHIAAFIVRHAPHRNIDVALD